MCVGSIPSFFIVSFCSLLFDNEALTSELLPRLLCRGYNYSTNTALICIQGSRLRISTEQQTDRLTTYNPCMAAVRLYMAMVNYNFCRHTHKSNSEIHTCTCIIYNYYNYEVMQP